MKIRNSDVRNASIRLAEINTPLYQYSGPNQEPSKDAALSAQLKRRKTQTKILEYLRKIPDNCEGLQERFGQDGHVLQLLTVRNRTYELERFNFIYKTGRTAQSAGKRQSTVWQLTPFGEEALSGVLGTSRADRGAR